MYRPTSAHAHCQRINSLRSVGYTSVCSSARACLKLVQLTTHMLGKTITQLNAWLHLSCEIRKKRALCKVSVFRDAERQIPVSYTHLFVWGIRTTLGAYL